MPIWVYKDTSPDTSIESVSTIHCIFCQMELDTFENQKWKRNQRFYFPDKAYCEIGFCPGCGWWRVRTHLDYWWSSTKNAVIDEGAAGSLKVLDLADIRIPMEEVKSYLVAKYEARLTMSPRLFEETVASVFHDLGYEAIVTSATNDGGIDVVLTSSDNTKIGVQVKRWKNVVKVEQIRSFAGALLLGKFTKGVFVTTSDFQSGVQHTVGRFKMRGYPIELVNAQRFYDALKIAQKTIYQRPTDPEVYIRTVQEISHEVTAYED